MDKIERLLEKAFKNNKTIDMDDILDLELTDDEYSALISVLESKGITIREEIYAYDDEEAIGFIADDNYKLYLNDIGERPLLTFEEEKELFRKYKATGDKKIREKLIESNLRLVISIANGYKSKLSVSSHELLDIIQEGNTGLMRAIDKYDVELGNKFSTYATWWIRVKIERALDNTGKIIRVPCYVVYAYNKIQKYKKIAAAKGERVPTDYEVALELGIDKTRVEEIIQVGRRVVISANEPTNDEDKTTRIDYFADPSQPLEEQVIDKMSFEMLENIMREKLTEKEFFVICTKLGIVNEVNHSSECKTLQEIGEIMGVSRERVRQILNNAYRKMKIQCKRNNIVVDGEPKKYMRW